MMKRSFVIVLAMMWVGGTVMAEQSRPQFTKENRFPDLEQVELGTIVQHNELGERKGVLDSSDANELVVEPFVRYRAFENVTFLASLPYVDVDPDMGEGASGLGDASVGLEWHAYENISGYPYIIPHVTGVLDTGDEKDGTGLGESRFKFGVTLGTVRWDDWSINGDVSYTFFDDSENILSGALSLLWSVSEDFSWLVEGIVTDEDVVDSADAPAFGQFGLSYHPDGRFQFTATGGAGKNQRRDVSATLKMSYNL